MLLEFYGRECPHCIKVAPLVERLEKEEGVKFERYEVWHDEGNLKKMQDYDKGLCGGVPFFFNTETNKFICGEASYEELKNWSKGGMIEAKHSPAQKEIDYNYIDDGIFIGTNQCCQTHFDEDLKSKGIEADISLEENEIDMPFGIKFFLWLPVKDHTAPTQEQLNVGVAALEKLVASGEKVYIHCKNGHGRAPTLAAAFFIKKGMSIDEAINHVKEKRPSTHLEEEQIKALETFKNSIT